MLIRNAVVNGLRTDLRLMHGRVQEMGVGLLKGLYESEINLDGDELRCCTSAQQLPLRFRRRAAVQPPGTHIACGTPSPLLRWREGKLIGVIDEHAAD